MAEVIVVVSDLALKHSIAFVLESAGLRVLSYRTVEAALEPPQSRTAACAVIDEDAIVKPDRARALVTIFGRPVIVLTDNSHMSASLGTSLSLTKPFLGEPLLRAVRQAIGGEPEADT